MLIFATKIAKNYVVFYSLYDNTSIATENGQNSPNDKLKTPVRKGDVLTEANGCFLYDRYLFISITVFYVGRC